MGLKQTILNSVSKAFDVTDDIMDTYTFSANSSTSYDPATSENTVSTSTQSIKGFIDTDSEGYKGLSAVSQFDLVVYIKPTTISPAVGDTLTVNSSVYSIVYIMNITVGDTVALHRLWLKQ